MPGDPYSSHLAVAPANRDKTDTKTSLAAVGHQERVAVLTSVGMSNVTGDVMPYSGKSDRVVIQERNQTCDAP